MLAGLGEQVWGPISSNIWIFFWPWSGDLNSTLKENLSVKWPLSPESARLQSCLWIQYMIYDILFNDDLNFGASCFQALFLGNCIQCWHSSYWQCKAWPAETLPAVWKGHFPGGQIVAEAAHDCVCNHLWWLWDFRFCRSGGSILGSPIWPWSEWGDASDEACSKRKRSGLDAGPGGLEGPPHNGVDRSSRLCFLPTSEWHVEARSAEVCCVPKSDGMTFIFFNHGWWF